MIPHFVLELLKQRKDVVHKLGPLATLNGGCRVSYYKDRYTIHMDGFYMYVYCHDLEKWFHYEPIERAHSPIGMTHAQLQPVLNSAPLCDKDFFLVCANGGVALVKQRLTQ